MDTWECKVLTTFLKGDRLTKIPDTRKKRAVILRWLAQQFEKDKTVSRTGGERHHQAIPSRLRHPTARANRSAPDAKRKGYLLVPLGGGVNITRVYHFN